VLVSGLFARRDRGAVPLRGRLFIARPLCETHCDRLVQHPPPFPEFAPGATPPAAQYELTGRLLLIQYSSSGNRLIELNLLSGATTVIFQAPSASWLGEAVVSPDGRTVLLAYSPPPPPGEFQMGHTGLYLLALDGSAAPQPLLTPQGAQDAFFSPT
jgi:hypothetical protein